MAALPDLETETTKALMSNHYTPESEQNLGELVNKLKTSSSTHLRDLLSKMLNDADQQLLDMADNAAYSHEKDVFYWLKNKLKDKKPEVASDFMLLAKTVAEGIKHHD